ncbi:MAG: shikimate dehydrogenase, partial [Lentisphaeraceae bacterium]|nr:shikimate dehydrogenase [Lentisphaeraceae bacterium]
MKNYALIGWPVAHSVSPPMQNAGFNEAQLSCNYELAPIHPDALAETVIDLKEKFSGWNCTVPHKQAIIPFLDDIDETAKILGSVNTVVNENGKLKGYSTDGFGMEQSLKESFDISIKGQSFLFIGAGGAARAVALHFAMQGAGKIAILNRTVSKAEALTDEINKIDASIATEVSSLQSPDIDINSYKVVLQCTSMGLHTEDPMPIDHKLFNAKQVVVDMIYKKTPFLQAAEKIGCAIADGRGMLLHQGVKAWEIWT